MTGQFLLTKEAEDLATRVDLLEECLRLMISYLGHQDQDANHGWMALKMREALLGKHPAANLEAALVEYGLEDLVRR